MHKMLYIKPFCFRKAFFYFFSRKNKTTQHNLTYIHTIYIHFASKNKLAILLCKVWFNGFPSSSSRKGRVFFARGCVLRIYGALACGNAFFIA
jgi:hypothetical protein